MDEFDPGWWRGRGPDGNYGIFPANFVELIGESGETTTEPEPTPDEVLNIFCFCFSAFINTTTVAIYFRLGHFSWKAQEHLVF